MACTVLVTGVSGFVGGALGQHLRECGYGVLGLSRGEPRTGSVDRFAAHDLAQPVPGDLFSHAPEVIVHCAALSSPWASPAAYEKNNVQATANLLDYAARVRARQFVFVSSSSVHYIAGRDQMGLTEESALPADAINRYAATKRRGEKLVTQAGLPCVILRPRAVFGPGDTVLFPRILRAARRGVLPRIVRPDGESPWGDLIFIDNLSHYLERAIAAGASGIYNLTNAEPVQMYAFLERIFGRLGIPPPRRRVKVGTAMLAARVFETVSRTLMGYKEPPITRFGVEVMAYSKTFDVRKMTGAFGQPPISISQGVERFVSWQQLGR